MYETTFGHKYQVGDEVWAWLFGEAIKVVILKAGQGRYCCRYGERPSDYVDFLASDLYPTPAAASAAQERKEG